MTIEEIKKSIEKSIDVEATQFPCEVSAFDLNTIMSDLSKWECYVEQLVSSAWDWEASYWLSYFDENAKAVILIDCDIDYEWNCWSLNELITYVETMYSAYERYRNKFLYFKKDINENTSR